MHEILYCWYQVCVVEILLISIVEILLIWIEEILVKVKEEVTGVSCSPIQLLSVVAVFEIHRTLCVISCRYCRNTLVWWEGGGHLWSHTNAEWGHLRDTARPLPSMSGWQPLVLRNLDPWYTVPTSILIFGFRSRLLHVAAKEMWKVEKNQFGLVNDDHAHKTI